MKIVLIEDDPLQIESFVKGCEEKKITTSENISIFYHPDTFISSVSIHNSDTTNIACILLDLQLDGSDDRDRSGLSFVANLRKVVGDVPIIAYTYHSEIHELADITSHNIDGILLKPDFSSTKMDSSRFLILMNRWRNKRRLAPLVGFDDSSKTEFCNPSILHMSDLQFGRAFFKPKKLADIITKALQGQNPNIVVVSGDITQNGSPEEYAMAQEFFEAICEKLCIKNRRQIVIAPGNHDVSWPLGKGAYVNESWEKVDDLVVSQQLYMYKMAPFWDFWSKFYNICGGIGLFENNKQYRIFDLTAVGFLFVVFNSSYLECCKNRDNGQIRLEDMDALEPELSSFKKRTDVVIAAVFHHPLQIGVGIGGGTDTSDILNNAPATVRALCELGVRLVFTGHVHASCFERIELDTAVAAPGSGLINILAGSAGVPEGDRPTAGLAGHARNEFNLIKCIRLPDEWELHAYEMDPLYEAFLPKNKFPGHSHKKAFKLLDLLS